MGHAAVARTTIAFASAFGVSCPSLHQILAPPLRQIQKTCWKNHVDLLLTENTGN